MIPNTDPTIRAVYDFGATAAVLAWDDDGHALIASPSGRLVPANSSAGEDVAAGEFGALVGLGKARDTLTIARVILGEKAWEIGAENIAAALGIDMADAHATYEAIMWAIP